MSKEKKKTPATRMRDQRKQAMLNLLKKNTLNINESCKILNINNQTYYRWLKTDPEFNARIEELERTLVHAVESKLYEHIMNKTDPRLSFDAAKYFLSRKGANYGWADKEKVEEKEVRPLEIKIINTPEDKEDNIIDMPSANN